MWYTGAFRKEIIEETQETFIHFFQHESGIEREGLFTLSSEASIENFSIHPCPLIVIPKVSMEGHGTKLQYISHLLCDSHKTTNYISFHGLWYQLIRML